VLFTPGSRAVLFAPGSRRPARAARSRAFSSEIGFREVDA
jgi:hypothetical protein